MIWITRIFLIQAVPLFIAAIPLNASETSCELEVPTEYTEEDPTDGEIADVSIEIGVPVNRGYRRYNRGYYRYPFYYVDDPYYYYGPEYFHYYGRYYDDDDDDCRGRRHHRSHRCHDDDDDD